MGTLLDKGVRTGWNGSRGLTLIAAIAVLVLLFASLQSICALVQGTHKEILKLKIEFGELQSQLNAQANLATALRTQEPKESTLRNDCQGFSNKYTTSFASIFTRGLDWRAYCEGEKAGTDKVNPHSYQYIYSKYLSPMHNEPVIMLEIGLGCSMSYGPGKSLKMWRSLFPYGRISFMEYNAPCAEKHREEIEKQAGGILYTGDQTNSTLLQKVVADAVGLGLYDLIVDDGGHNPTAQLLSLEGLWPALKSGGIYVVEDVQTNFFREDFKPQEFKPTGSKTFMGWVPRMVRLIHCHAGWFNAFSQQSKAECANATQLEREVLTIECQSEACVLVKR